MTKKPPSNAGGGNPGLHRDPKLGPAQISSFQESVLSHYRTHGRDLPWRRTEDPYRVLVSEVMLQQTQVRRVAEKFGPFVERFVDFTALDSAPLIEVLAHWKGLGYNRRALYLKETARIVVERYGGRLPEQPEELATLPGIGKNTAGAIAAFAFNRPAVFIETNIRTVFIHRFFADQTDVTDSRIIPLVEAPLFRTDPRVWYWALMDYGTAIKEMTENPGRRSAHHTRQSPFAGSNREIRGAILKILIDADDPAMTEAKITAALPMEPPRVRRALVRLVEEGFVVRDGGRYRIA